MTIQRYSIYGSDSISSYDKGEWVRFKDHQKALSTLEARITELEKALTTAEDDMDTALRQWKMYADDQDERDLHYDNDAESLMYRGIRTRQKELVQTMRPLSSKEPASGT
jgi:hypothetical protein